MCDSTAQSFTKETNTVKDKVESNKTKQPPESKAQIKFMAFLFLLSLQTPTIGSARVCDTVWRERKKTMLDGW